MKPKKRYETAWKMHQSGKTFREIGEKLCVSAVRARQLAMCHQKQTDTVSNNAFVIEIQKINSINTTRILNALNIRFGNIETLSPDLLSSTGYKKICAIRNIGKKSANVIALALENIGSIKDAQKWKAKTKRPLKATRKRAPEE